MVNIVLYDSESVLRVAKKAVQYFAARKDLRTTEDTIWIEGLYLRFYPRLITVNTYGTTAFSNKDVLDCLNHVLKDEEVFLTSDKRKGTYINSVDDLAKSDVNFFN